VKIEYLTPISQTNIFIGDKMQSKNGLPPIPKIFIDEFNNLINRLPLENRSKYSKLREIYSFIDNFNAKYVFTTLKPSCVKGCAACCSIDVTIHDIEAQYIEKNTGIKMLSKSPSLSIIHDTACPFLEDDKCSIYEHRPFVCRVYHVLSPSELCYTGADVAMYGAAPLFGNDIFKNMFLYINLELASTPKAIRDIRDFFGMSL
jgi:uncharacterized protein